MANIQHPHLAGYRSTPWQVLSYRSTPWQVRSLLSVRLALRGLYAGVPVLCNLIAAAVVLRYPIDRARHAELQRLLGRGESESP